MDIWNCLVLSKCAFPADTKWPRNKTIGPLSHLHALWWMLMKLWSIYLSPIIMPPLWNYEILGATWLTKLAARSHFLQSTIVLRTLMALTHWILLHAKPTVGNNITLLHEAISRACCHVELLTQLYNGQLINYKWLEMVWVPTFLLKAILEWPWPCSGYC